MSYADGTRVSIEKSQSEIKKLLTAHGLAKWAVAEEASRSRIVAVIEKDGKRLTLSFQVVLPDCRDRKIVYTPSGQYLRTPDKREEAYQSECKRRWRALLLLVKARFEAVEAGITTLAEEFLPNMMLPSGETVSEWAMRDIGPALAEGRMPSRLLLDTGAPVAPPREGGGA